MVDAAAFPAASTVNVTALENNMFSNPPAAATGVLLFA